MNLLEILKKIYSCTMPQAASEGDMDSISPSDKTNDTASADNAEVEGIQPVVLKRSKAEVIEGYGQVRTMADILISLKSATYRV